MKTYQINAPHFCAGVIVSNGLVFQAAPILGWAVTKPFTTLRDYCQKRGWAIVPIEQKYEPQWVEWNNDVYELHWHEEVLCRIVLHERGEEPCDIAFDELPPLLRRALL